MRRRKKPAIISLFTGAMGLDLGLEKAGFKTRVVVEIDRRALDTIKATDLRDLEEGGPEGRRGGLGDRRTKLSIIQHCWTS
jgi:site-specific DNA-cytosine methylase